MIPTYSQNGNEARKQLRRIRARRAAALIMTLIAIAISSLLAAGIATLVVAHNTRSRAEADAARSLDMAESGLNFQLQRIFATLNTAQVAYNGTNIDAATYGLRALPFPVTGKSYNAGAGNLNAFLGLTVTNDPATSDYCVGWIEYPSDATRGLDLTVAEDVFIYGQARVNGVVRTVRAKAGADGLFTRWAVFADSLMDIGGSFSVTPLTGTEVGIVAGNGVIDINKDTDAVGGQIIYGTGVPDPDFPYAYGGRTAELPTINELAEAAYLAGGYPSTSNTGVYKFIGAAVTATNNDNQAYGLLKRNGNNSTWDPLPATGIFPNNAGYPLKLTGKSGGANFYMNRLDGSGVTIWADVSAGPVNLWITNTETGNQANDQIQGNIDIVAYTEMDNTVSPPRPVLNLENSKLFHVYYSNEHGSLGITGGGSTQNIYAMLYAYNLFNGVPKGEIQVAGTVTVNGAAYTHTVSGNGNFQVNYPTSTSIADGAGIFFGLRQPWQEVAPTRGN